MRRDFAFLDPGPLIDGDLQLVLVAKNPADPSRAYAPYYGFDMVLTGTRTRVGHLRLRVGNTRDLCLFAGHIGYGVDPQHRGRRYAARACRLVVPLARKHGLNPLWITVNPDNKASRRCCEILGAELVEIVDLPADSEMYGEGERRKCRYRLRLGEDA